MKVSRTFRSKRGGLVAVELIIALAVAFGALAAGQIVLASLGAPRYTALAACGSAPASSDLGLVTQTIKTGSEGSFRLWSRIKADGAANSYGWQIDDGCVYTVGNSDIPSNSWTWVDYQDATTGSKIEPTLAAGEHTIKYYGLEANVQLDKIMLLGDKGCVPEGLGDNCAQVDETSPTVMLTAPQAASVITGNATIRADASDANGISKVEFYANGSLRGTDTTAPYEFSFDSTQWANNNYSLTARAYDPSDNVKSSDAVTVMIQNPDPIPKNGNLLRGKATTSTVADSTSEAGNPLANVVDGNAFTRWISQPVDGAVITTDLGSVNTIQKISILWAADTVKNYEIQVSSDNSTWKSVAEGVTNNTQRQLIETTSFKQAATGRYLRIVAKDRWNPAFGNSIWEIGAYASAAAGSTPATATDGGYYLSDMIPVTAVNGWGPYERDMSNYDQAPNDGETITIAGKAYAKGLGIHAPAALTYDIKGSYSTFKAIVGMDYLTGAKATDQGAVTFEVWGDGRRLYESPLVKRGMDSYSVNVNVEGVKLLKLVVTDGGNGNGNDHALWAEARLLPGSGFTTPSPSISPTVTPVPTINPGDSAAKADLNRDGRVNILDLSLLLADWGKSLKADINVDGKTDIIDLSKLLAAWTR